MATCLSIVTTALRRIGILAEGEQPNAEQTADALEALQDMLADWEGKGVALGGLVGDALASGDVLPLPATQIRAVKLNLAVELAPEYGAAAVLSPLLVEQADTAFRGLQAQYADNIPMTVEPALLHGGRVGYRVV